MIFPWNKTVNLSQEKRKKTREMFQGVLDLVTLQGQLLDVVESC